MAKDKKPADAPPAEPAPESEAAEPAVEAAAEPAPERAVPKPRGILEAGDPADGNICPEMSVVQPRPNFTTPLIAAVPCIGELCAKYKGCPASKK